MNDDLLRELLITSKGMEAPPLDVPPELKKRFEAAIAQYCTPPQVLSEASMMVVILKILSNGSADGGEIISKLNEVRVRLAPQGEGVLYALLARMEGEELISGQFDAAMVRRAYRMEDRGSKLLNRGSEAVRTISEQLALLWAS